MTFSANSNHPARSQASERVAAWKQDVQSFFAEDWSRLRTLMMELEEDSWSSDSAFQSNPLPAQRAVIQTASKADFQCSATQHNASATDSAVRPPAKDRLSALAEQIERRLQSAIAVGK
jgi:hypothetical protein